MVKHVLVVVDMQKDFIDGALGTPEAVAVVPKVVEKIANFEGTIFVTYDTHDEDYLISNEGRHLPMKHCIKGTPGWELDARIASVLEQKPHTKVEKPTFGSVELPELVECAMGPGQFTLELVGLCTDICVVSNALLLKAYFPEMQIFVDGDCCAGVTPESHAAALTTMKMCQINVKGGA